MNVYLCNAPDVDALRIAKTLVQEHLCACVNLISSATSVYEWDGVIEEATETIMVIKSASPHEHLRNRILALHPYDLPEVICLGVELSRSHKAYVNWVNEASGAGP